MKIKRFLSSNSFTTKTEDVARNYFGQIGETHVFSPNAVNEFRAAFNRTDRRTAIGPVNAAIASLITPDMSFVPGLPFGRMTFTGGALGLGGRNIQLGLKLTF